MNLRICLIGAGPRGTSVLERLCANAAGTPQRVVVDVVDPAPAGPGMIFEGPKAMAIQKILDGSGKPQPNKPQPDKSQPDKPQPEKPQPDKPPETNKPPEPGKQP